MRLSHTIQAFTSNPIRLVTMSCTASIFSFLILFFLIIPSHALSSASPTPSPLETICNDTSYPDFCMSMQPNNKSVNIHDFGRFGIQKSLDSTNRLLSVIDSYLTSSQQSFSVLTIRALEDAKLLLGLNIDFLSNAAQVLKSDASLPRSQADDIHTLLSATLTNQETCQDGLKATTEGPKFQESILTPLSNCSKLYSVSLAVFKHGWGPVTTQGRWLAERLFPFSHIEFGPNGQLPVRMSSQHRKIYESVSGRKLLQTSGGSVNVSQIVVVNPNGSGNFTTISAAVAAAPNNTPAGQGFFMIYIVAGIYQEYISIATNKKYLMMVGAGINQTIITGNHSVADNYTTFNSATFAVTAPGFVAINITFQNTAGAIKNQAVALRSGADLSAFYKCSFEGYQDTLYTHSMRQFYRECDVYGTVDYIFGNAAVVFQNCNLYPRLPLHGQFNTITAQGRTDINQNTGTSIQNCTITAAPDLASSNGTTQTYLGRPWQEYSTTVYMQSFMDSLINPAGWAPWSGNFALSTLYYAEYNNTGPGSNTSNRVTWPGYHIIGATDAANFTVSNFISGDYWLPQTGIPYTGGLM